MMLAMVGHHVGHYIHVDTEKKRRNMYDGATRRKKCQQTFKRKTSKKNKKKGNKKRKSGHPQNGDVDASCCVVGSPTHARG